MNESREPDSNVTVERDVQSAKHPVPSFLTEDGMQSDESDPQPRNTRYPIFRSREPDSNVTVESDSHLAKHFAPSLSTEEGMQIDESELPLNAASPIHETFESDAKMTLEIVSQPEKQPSSNRVTSRPITTSVALPKYRFIEWPSKSKRQSPTTLN
jgi:hypothetical protein